MPKTTIMSWLAIAQTAPEHIKEAILLEHQTTISPEEQAELDLYHWTLNHTSEASLFYYDSLPFRFWTRRGLTHNWKDIATVYYAGARVKEVFERYQTAQSAYKSETELLNLAKNYGADYIVIDLHQSAIAINLPVAFSNHWYRVYSLQ